MQIAVHQSRKWRKRIWSRDMRSWRRRGDLVNKESWAVKEMTRRMKGIRRIRRTRKVATRHRVRELEEDDSRTGWARNWTSASNPERVGLFNARNEWGHLLTVRSKNFSWSSPTFFTSNIIVDQRIGLWLTLTPRTILCNVNSPSR